MLDAYEAIKKAVFYNTEISCPDVFCTTMNFRLNNLPKNPEIKWDIVKEDDVKIFSGVSFPSMSSGFIQNKYTMSGLITLRATITYKGVSTVIEKDVYMDDGDTTIAGTVEQEGFYSGVLTKYIATVKFYSHSTSGI